MNITLGIRYIEDDKTFQWFNGPRVAASRPFATDEAQNRTDFRVHLSSLSIGLSLSAFVNNAFDQRYANGVNGIARDTLGTSFSSITEPRVWGLEIGYDF